MCGIFGIAGHKAQVSAQMLERAAQSLVHRGPDDGGTITLRDDDCEIGLGSRRLAILDLSPLGHQPMNDPETGNWIVYNGEIYNFQQVRTKLEQQGARFETHCDTEVILKAYARWGETCLDEFRGMFAFAVWDAAQHRLFLARDPMGIKPLYFYQSERYFLFSSEVRTLLGTGLVGRQIDPVGLAGYLTFGSVYAQHTLVEGVRALAPGCCLTWKAGELKQRQYWHLVDSGLVESSRENSFAGAEKRKELECEIAAMLDEAVRLQMVSDVPVGVFLSGGIDSSALAGILSRNGVLPSTFSIVFREQDYSEAEYSRAVAEKFGTDHHEITVSQADLFAAIDPAIRAMDQPTIDGINTYFVSERTRAAGVKVAISGLGGDEMFAGYSTFHTVPRMESLAYGLNLFPPAVRHLLGNLFAGLAPETDQNRKLAALARDGVAPLHPYFLSRMLFTPEQQYRLLECCEGSANGFQQLKSMMDETISAAEGLDPINRVSYLEASSYMLNMLLRDSDFMSMAHGLEVRVPLIDHLLARTILALPGSWKLDANTPKPLLVHALRGELPKKIVQRPKRGFTMPFEHWLRDALRPAIEGSLARLCDGPLAAVINATAARDIWNDFLRGKTSWSRPWAIHVLQCWCEKNSMTT